MSLPVGIGLAVHYALGGPRFLRDHRRNTRVLVILAIGILIFWPATLSAIMV